MHTDGWEPEKIDFRLLVEADLPLLQKWLTLPHVSAWWGTPDVDPETVRAKYLPRVRSQDPATPYVILYQDLPVGYVQTYPVAEGQRDAHIHGTAIGLDLFIGDPQYAHRGLGPHVIVRFLQSKVFADGSVTRCYADPAVRNGRSIRAFEKAGFRRVATKRDAPDPICLMCVDAKSVRRRAFSR
jgi:RimJ/RimL family protein N-acetyltransferase